MGRHIVTEKSLESMKGTEAISGRTSFQVDGYWDRVIKNIPGDVVAGWTALLGLFGVSPGAIGDTQTTTILWVLWALLTIITFFWTYRQTRVTGAQPAWTQVFISTFAFVVWALALGVPFNTLPFFDPRIAAAILIVYTLAVGAIQPSE